MFESAEDAAQIALQAAEKVYQRALKLLKASRVPKKVAKLAARRLRKKAFKKGMRRATRALKL